MNMALSSCFFSSQICVSFKIDRSRMPSKIWSNKIKSSQSCRTTLKSIDTQVFGPCIGWSFLGGSIRTLKRPNLGRIIVGRKSSAVYASWLLNSEIASNAFTVGTVAVLPFYTFMVVAPQAQITKKLVGSSIPYIVLGSLYAYLLYLSWTPDTIQLMFASKYWLPELPGMAQMFSSEMTLASAWIHLLVVDLFAARQVYFDGQENNIETRHSVSLCLLFCPVGILAHFITKALSGSREKAEHGIH